MNDSLPEGCLTVIGVILLLPLLPILGAFFGGIAGYMVGWAFPYVLDTVREAAGITLSNFQIGATLGFIGSFFRSGK